jgi:hypothetical protein
MKWNEMAKLRLSTYIRKWNIILDDHTRIKKNSKNLEKKYEYPKLIY